MVSRLAWKPWHEVVQLRNELKTGELSLSIFAADLYDVVMGRARPIYQNPYDFFSFTFPPTPCANWRKMSCCDLLVRTIRLCDS